ncbi:unnamed protein product, partial [Rotaria sp. Silwood2]
MAYRTPTTLSPCPSYSNFSQDKPPEYSTVVKYELDNQAISFHPPPPYADPIVPPVTRPPPYVVPPPPVQNLSCTEICSQNLPCTK